MEIRDIHSFDHQKKQLEGTLEQHLRALSKLGESVKNLLNSNDTSNKDVLERAKKMIDERFKKGKAFYCQGKSSEPAYHMARELTDETGDQDLLCNNNSWLIQLIERFNKQLTNFQRELHETEDDERRDFLKTVIPLHSLRLGKLENLRKMNPAPFQAEEEMLVKLKQVLTGYLDSADVGVIDEIDDEKIKCNFKDFSSYDDNVANITCADQSIDVNFQEPLNSRGNSRRSIRSGASSSVAVDGRVCPIDVLEGGYPINSNSQSETAIGHRACRDDSDLKTRFSSHGLSSSQPGNNFDGGERMLVNVFISDLFESIERWILRAGFLMDAGLLLLLRIVDQSLVINQISILFLHKVIAIAPFCKESSGGAPDDRGGGGSKSSYLTLNKGDRVAVTARDPSGWAFGHVLDPQGTQLSAGWFPESFTVVSSPSGVALTPKGSVQQIRNVCLTSPDLQGPLINNSALAEKTVNPFVSDAALCRAIRLSAGNASSTKIDSLANMTINGREFLVAPPAPLLAPPPPPPKDTPTDAVSDSRKVLQSDARRRNSASMHPHVAGGRYEESDDGCFSGFMKAGVNDEGGSTVDDIKASHTQSFDEFYQCAGSCKGCSVSTTKWRTSQS
eukprot:GHVL01018237.1.p1 GENE.GHVL01018237.1~~GHVL01018237.1.p1  ORF type:complete len:618 (+),score=110.57 GHVL01018237.1:443-2296(+)